MPKRYNNTIYKLFFKGKKIIKIILSSITRIWLIKCIKDPKEASSINHVYIEEDTVVKETTIVDITTTSHPVRNNAISVINMDAS